MNNNIHPCIWFDGNAKAAADFYCSLFPDSKITADTPMVVNFELAEQKFMGLNGGPMFKPNASISFTVICETDDEINELWKQLSADGMIMMPLDKYEWSERYGFLQDRFGVCWQIIKGKYSDVNQKITPTLLFVGKSFGQAEKAVKFYTQVFPQSSIDGILLYTKEEGEAAGTVKHAQFILDKKVFMAMDGLGNHPFAFNEGISFVVDCETQEEIDDYWNKLTADGGQESQCGWLKDKFGVSWQIVPVILGKLMSDPERSQKVMQAFMKMKKFDIAALMNA
jgi:predicted 3-demethylubiquinone-9 3-methyltransferase (glyoxalase superfamily)